MFQTKLHILHASIILSIGKFHSGNAKRAVCGPNRVLNLHVEGGEGCICTYACEIILAVNAHIHGTELID